MVPLPPGSTRHWHPNHTRPLKCLVNLEVAGRPRRPLTLGGHLRLKKTQFTKTTNMYLKANCVTQLPRPFRRG